MVTPHPLLELPPVPPTENPELGGLRSPLRSECDLAGGFDLVGVLPPGLEGLLLFHGPNPALIPDPDSFSHAMGDGMVHSIEILDGRPHRMRSRWVITRQMVERLGFRAPPGPLRAAGRLANRSLVRLGPRLIALDGDGLGYRLSPELETLEVDDLDATLSAPMGSQVVTDPTSEESAFLGLDPHGPPFLRYHETSALGELAFTTALPIGLLGTEPGLGVSELAIAVIESSLSRREDEEERVVSGEVDFDPDHRPHIGLLPRRAAGTGIVWVPSDPGHVGTVLRMLDTTHGATLVVVRAEPEKAGDPSWRPSGRQGLLEELEVDADDRRTTLRTLDDLVLDGAVTDPRSWGDDRRHAYAVDAAGTTLLKYSLTSGQRERRELEAGLVASRPMFVRDPEGHSDDEGWLITPIFDRSTSTSSLLILDATSFSGPPQALLRLPARLPLDLTGLHLTPSAYR